MPIDGENVHERSVCGLEEVKTVVSCQERYRQESHLMEKCDGHGGGVQGFRGV